MGPAVTPAVAGFLDHPDRFARNGASEVLQNLGVLDEIAGRAARGEVTAEDRSLLAKAAAAGGIVPATDMVRRILPGAPDRMRALLTSAAGRRTS
jgi:hypothetical protein